MDSGPSPPQWRVERPADDVGNKLYAWCRPSCREPHAWEQKLRKYKGEGRVKVFTGELKQIWQPLCDVRGFTISCINRSRCCAYSVDCHQELMPSSQQVRFEAISVIFTIVNYDFLEIKFVNSKSLEYFCLVRNHLSTSSYTNHIYVLCWWYHFNEHCGQAGMRGSFESQPRNNRVNLI